MKRTVTVLVAGVPTAGQDVRKWKEKATFKIRGKKPETPKDKLFETFKPRATDWLRKGIAKCLKESVELLRRDITAQVEDAGEFLFDAPTEFEGQIGLNEEEMVGLAREFSEKSSGFDLSILVGGDHAGGLLLYALEGKVARFDLHSDACETPRDCPAGEVSRNTYVCAAIRNLKNEDEIVGVGVKQGRAIYHVAERAVGAGILDIDVDAISQRHGIKTGYGHGVLSPDDLVAAVRKNAPKAIGFFEAVEGDGKALALAERLCEEAVIAAAKRGKAGAGKQ